jgi:Dullard-like phosphatase family protein
MRPFKGQKSQISLQGNIVAKSNKLTIEVPEDEDDGVISKFNKNSPFLAKHTTEIPKSPGSLFAPKQKVLASSKASKRCYGDVGSPRSASKIFKFPSTPKSPRKMSSRPLIPTPTKTKTKNPSGSKFSNTPTQRGPSEVTMKRPRTATNLEKANLKAETGSSPSLNVLVTQVKSNSARAGSGLSDEEIQAKSEMLYKEHLFQTFQAMKFVRTLPPVNLDQLKEKRVTVPRKKGFESKKTLVFDLDETLVHCCEDTTTSKPMVVLPVVFPTGEVVQAGINIRPYALECLKEVNKYFEVFVFTASHPCYANVVLDYLDPKKELIHQRFFRDSCVNMGGVFIKDLRIFVNRSLKDIIIVDNAAYSFGYQLDNGIPIISWHDDPYDKELFNLMDYVKALASVDDIRDVNDQTFHLRTFYEDYINEFLANDALNSPKEGKKLSN